MKKLFLLIILFSHFTLMAQRTKQDTEKAVDAIAVRMSEGTLSKTEQAKKLFDWVATEITYDVNKTNGEPFKEDWESVRYALSRKKGVCDQYVDVFRAVAEKLGIPTMKVEGYTQQFGVLNKVSHSWLIAQLDGRWVLIDPTWGAGYVDQKGKYHKVADDLYFDIDPDTLIKTHCPFDPIFQLRSYPLSNKGFIQQKFDVQTQLAYCNFNDSLRIYPTLSDQERVEQLLARMRLAGLEGEPVKRYYQLWEGNLETIKFNRNVDFFNQAVYYYNKAGEQLSSYQRKKDLETARFIQDDLDFALKYLDRMSEPNAELRRNAKDIQAEAGKIKRQLSIPKPDYKTGDLLFAESKGDGFGEAIEAVTQSSAAYNFSHVGIVEVASDGVFVLEAIGKGVVRTPLVDFMNRPDYYRVRQARLKEAYQSYIPSAVSYIKTLLGKPYDWAFDLNNDTYYCSELIYVGFVHASGDKAFFETPPMTFKKPGSSEIFPTWGKHFQDLGIAVPEGEPGLNPGGMSRSGRVFML